MIRDNFWQPNARSNCWVFAYFNRFLAGGVVHKVESDRWWGGFHLIWQAPDGRRLSYLPVDEGKISFWRSWRVMFFYGQIKIH